MVEFEHEDIDLAIRHGQGEWPGLSAHYLFSNETIPVCSATLASADAPLDSPRDLKRHILLHTGARPDEWRNWLESVGQGGLKPMRELTFETTNFALAAAMKGVGIAITDRHILNDDLESGRLIAPFEQTLRYDSGYYLTYPADREAHPKITLFRDWLLREVAAM